jgi:hypothetical protein
MDVEGDFVSMLILIDSLNLGNDGTRIPRNN